MIDLELGPVLRALGKRRSAVSLLVLEVAFAFLVISTLTTTARWYLATASNPMAGHQRDLVNVVINVPAGMTPVDRQTSGLVAEAWLARLRAVPDVVAAERAGTATLDLMMNLPVKISSLQGGERRTVSGWTAAVGPTFLDVIGAIPREGVTLSAIAPGERAGAVVITRCLADALAQGGPRGSILGRTLEAPEVKGRVVGVVDDFLVGLPILRSSHCLAVGIGASPDERNLNFLVRAPPGGANAMAAKLPGLLGSGDATVTVTTFVARKSRYGQVATGLVVMLGILAALVALLALAGAVAVSAFLVAERRQQIALRRALGATRGRVLRYFLVENFIATTLGLILGFHLLLMTFPNMQNTFQGVQLSPSLLWLAAAFLILEGLLATAIPALRAARQSPASVSRRA